MDPCPQSPYHLLSMSQKRRLLSLIQIETIDNAKAMSYCSSLEGGGRNASILYEVPDQEGNERCQEHHHEKRETSDPGCVSQLRDQDVQDRKELKL